MKLNIEVDLEKFMDNWSGKCLNELIQDEIKAEVLKGVKKSPEYKKVVRERTEAALKLAIEGSV
jgi:hypothetical protein